MDEARLLNRELSWIDFNERVLCLADDEATPLLERAKFLSIFSSNLDEFYMVRVAGLKRQAAAHLSTRSPDGLTPREQLEAIAEKIAPLVQRHSRLFAEAVAPALQAAGIELRRWKDLDDGQREDLDALFYERIFPVVTPLAVDPGHPFPYISNLSLNLAVQVRNPRDRRLHFARVKVPPVLPRFLELSGGSIFVPVEDVIAANLNELFPGMEIVDHRPFRVTRNADVELEDDEAEDLLQALEDELRRRRFTPAVRLEVEANMPEHMLELLIRELQITRDDVHTVSGLLDLGGLMELYGLDRPELKDDPFVPGTHEDFVTHEDVEPDVFEVLGERDVLVHHPYDSFSATVLRFIDQAAADPDVLAIKQTLYRTSGRSPIVEALIGAAEAGKQVVVLVEITARFDEKANIRWARTLERAGCHVVYGVLGLKTHSKLCLVVRQERDRLRRYVHVGTGNYNPTTARIYEDLGLLTADPEVGADVSHLFNYLTGYSRKTGYGTLIVAPDRMRQQIIDLIQRETAAGSEGRVVMKVNSLVDEAIIEALYEASQAGTQVDLIVRGICSLRPGVAGLSENIRVRSILGRFLEHSRVFVFGRQQPQIYIGSADMMHRNLDRRVEALVLIRAEAIQKELISILDLALQDNDGSWRLNDDGSWSRIVPAGDEPCVNLQKRLMDRVTIDA